MTKITLTEKEFALLTVLLVGVEAFKDGFNLDEFTFKKVDNKKVHSFNYFGAKAFLCDDGETVVIAGGKIEAEKIIYFVGGEKEETILVFNNITIYQSENLYGRLEQFLEDSDEDYCFVQ